MKQLALTTSIISINRDKATQGLKKGWYRARSETQASGSFFGYFLHEDLFVTVFLSPRIWLGSW